MSIDEIVEVVRSSPQTFIKQIALNESVESTAHQAGVLVPKSAAAMFMEVPLQEKGISDVIIELKWPDRVTNTRYVYYSSKGEYRLTRLDHKLHVGDLLVLSKEVNGDIRAFEVAQSDANGFLETLGIELGERSASTVYIGNPDVRLVEARFKPRARLLLQLGDQLIKNESIALVELVKNSYDADAQKVDIYMEHVDDKEKGIIIIEDDGCGMSADIVEKVWLEPGSDFKSKKIQNKEASPKFDRLPLGEKGIGRFGVHKLGSVIEMTTKAESAKEVFVKIDWSDFEKYEYLEDVPIRIMERNSPLLFKEGRTGTNIVISNLRKQWDRGSARTARRTITAMVSPFEAIDSFKPAFDVFDKPGWFEDMLDWEKVKDYSLYKFKVELDGDSIVSFNYEFTPWANMSKVSGRTVDLNNPLVQSFKKLEQKDENGKKIPLILSVHNIGKIKFEGYIFGRDGFLYKKGIPKQEYNDYLDANGGIRVFRDGLRVYNYGEKEDDWLGMDLRRVNQTDKSLSRNIVLGAVYLDRDGSEDLIEKTNREGFVESPAYQALRAAILHCLDQIETLRFSDKKRLNEVYGPTPKSAPMLTLLGEVKDYVEANVSNEKGVRDKLNQYLAKIEADYKRMSETLTHAAGAGLSLSVVVHEVEKIIAEVKKVVERDANSERLLPLVKHLSSLIDGYSRIISRSSQTTEDIIRVINQGLFNCEYRLESHKIEVERAYRDYKGTPKVKLAMGLLISSVMNIVDNSIFWLERAFKANEKLQKRIYINLEERTDFIYLIMADNGTGFLLPTDDITEPFVSAKPGGMGLGLHIANEVMLAQGGRVFFPEVGEFEIPTDFKEGATVVFEFKK
ncbi:MAG: ATP-binding protein [Flavobacteriales bacterium]|nr:ATP-binding protein [Flavobacteriales bacterium]